MRTLFSQYLPPVTALLPKAWHDVRSLTTEYGLPEDRGAEINDAWQGLAQFPAAQVYKMASQAAAHKPFGAFAADPPRRIEALAYLARVDDSLGRFFNTLDALETDKTYKKYWQENEFREKVTRVRQDVVDAYRLFGFHYTMLRGERRYDHPRTLAIQRGFKNWLAREIPADMFAPLRPTVDEDLFVPREMPSPRPNAFAADEDLFESLPSPGSAAAHINQVHGLLSTIHAHFGPPAGMNGPWQHMGHQVSGQRVPPLHEADSGSGHAAWLAENREAMTTADTAHAAKTAAGNRRAADLLEQFKKDFLTHPHTDHVPSGTAGPVDPNYPPQSFDMPEPEASTVPVPARPPQARWRVEPDEPDALTARDKLVPEPQGFPRFPTPEQLYPDAPRLEPRKGLGPLHFSEAPPESTLYGEAKPGDMDRAAPPIPEPPYPPQFPADVEAHSFVAPHADTPTGHAPNTTLYARSARPEGTVAPGHTPERQQ